MVKREEKQRCFVIMPFEPDFNALYEDSIKPTVEKPPVSWECVRADKMTGSIPFTEDIHQQIGEATAIIADLTSLNPNVLYEVGLAHMAPKPVILITQSMDDVPTDLRHFRCIVYRFTPRGVKELETALKENLLESEERPERFKARRPPILPSPEPVDRAVEVDDEDHFKYSVQKYGFGYTKTSLVCSVDSDGNATFVREIELEAHTTVEEVNTYLLFPESSESPNVSIVPPRVECLTPGFTLTPNGDSSFNRFILRLQIDPPLPSGQTLSFTFTERTPQRLYAPDKSQIGKLPWDYYAWDISRPTKRLEMLVMFPVGFRPDKPTHDVWYSVGGSQIRNPAEYHRVRSCFKPDKMAASRVLKLSVDYPALGLTYVIRWEPPDKN